MKKILLIGPLPEPTTGVSLANQVVLDHLNEFNISVINTSFNKFEESMGRFSLKKFFYYLKMNGSIFKTLRADIVYLTPGQTFYGIAKYAGFILFASVLKKEIVLHLHGNYLGKQYSELKGLKRKVFKSLIRKASKGIVLSKSLRFNMAPFLKEEQIFERHNFVEDYLFLDSSNVLKKAEFSKGRIVFLSNLMEEKGILDLLEALKILEEQSFDYEAKIAGFIDKKNKELIANLISNLQNAEYIGVVKGAKKKEILEWGNIFVLPTYYSMEGQPISILEAMATGNIVLTSKHAGIPDIFEDGVNGYYVEKKNPRSIAEKIKFIVSAKNQSIIINNNYIKAEEKYKVSTFIEGLTRILNSKRD